MKINVFVIVASGFLKCNELFSTLFFKWMQKILRGKSNKTTLSEKYPNTDQK